MGDIINLEEYRKQKDAAAEKVKDEKITQAFVNHAKDLNGNK